MLNAPTWSDQSADAFALDETAPEERETAETAGDELEPALEELEASKAEDAASAERAVPFEEETACSLEEDVASGEELEMHAVDESASDFFRSISLQRLWTESMGLF